MSSPSSSDRDEPHSATLSLGHFGRVMQDASVNNDIDPVDFVRLALAGKYDNDGLQSKIYVNPLHHVDSPSLDAVTITRDYDSMIGITRSLPFSTFVTIYPVVPFKETLKRDNHIRYTIVRFIRSSIACVLIIRLFSLALRVLFHCTKFPISASPKSNNVTSHASSSLLFSTHILVHLPCQKRSSSSSTINASGQQCTPLLQSRWPIGQLPTLPLTLALWIKTPIFILAP